MTQAVQEHHTQVTAEELAHAFEEEAAPVDLSRYAFEDWLTLAMFWVMVACVFLQFFTRYVLNNSFAWTEEIARYGLMMLAFVGGAVVTRKRGQIAVELVSNLMKPGTARATLLAAVDLVTLGFLALLAYFSVTIVERMQFQRMTVFDLPMSLVYGGISLGCFLMLGRQILVVWANMRNGWRRPHDITQQISAD